MIQRAEQTDRSIKSLRQLRWIAKQKINRRKRNRETERQRDRGTERQRDRER